jgi:hypothetical protein
MLVSWRQLQRNKPTTPIEGISASLIKSPG